MVRRKKAQIKNYTNRLLLFVVDKNPLEVLESTPSAIRRAVSKLTKDKIKKSPAAGKWSIAQILSHLADGEIVFAYRLRKIISEPGSRIESYDQNLWAENLLYKKSNYQEKLKIFSEIRRANVQLLKSLKPAMWKRFGIHQERGKETVEKMVLLYAGHDMNHLKQIQHLAHIFRKK